MLEAGYIHLTIRKGPRRGFDGAIVTVIEKVQGNIAHYRFTRFNDRSSSCPISSFEPTDRYDCEVLIPGRDFYEA